MQTLTLPQAQTILDSLNCVAKLNLSSTTDAWIMKDTTPYLREELDEADDAYKVGDVLLAMSVSSCNKYLIDTGTTFLHFNDAEALVYYWEMYAEREQWELIKE